MLTVFLVTCIVVNIKEDEEQRSIQETQCPHTP